MNVNEEIKKTIYRYLERMDYSEKQIESKLLMLKKNYPKVKKYQEYTQQKIRAVISELVELGVIDDLRSMKQLIEQNLRSTTGIYRLKLKLLKKKYPKKLIEDELAKITSEVDRDLSQIIRVAYRKYQQFSSRHPEKKVYAVKQQLIAYLANRGFSFEEIKKIIDAVNRD